MSFNYTVTTTKKPTEVIQSLEASLKEEGFGILWNFDVQGKLIEKGLEFNDEFIVLEVCNPNDAKQILEMSKLAGYFLPCKIVVYVEDGTTHIGLPKPTSLMEFIDHPEIYQVANDVEQRLISSLNKAK